MLERILRKVRPSGNLPVACPEGHVASSVAHRVSKHFRQSVIHFHSPTTSAGGLRPTGRYIDLKSGVVTRKVVFTTFGMLAEPDGERFPGGFW